MAERRPLVMIGGSLRELPDGDSISMTRVWQSGMTVTQGERVISPLDWEEYRRIAATGGGTTDPADDLTNYNALTYRRVTGLGSPPTLVNNAQAGNFANGATKVLVGVLAAGVRTEIFSATGRGSLAFLGFLKAATGGGRFELEVDGRAVFDDSIQSASSEVTIFVGAPGSGGSGPLPAFSAIAADVGVQFRRSVRIHYTPAGAVTTNNTTLAYLMRSER